MFTGSIAAAPVTAVALPGIVLTAALFLRAFQQVFTGPAGGRSEGFVDLRAHETVPTATLLALSLVIGVLPGPLLALIEPAADTVIGLIGR